MNLVAGTLVENFAPLMAEVGACLRFAAESTKLKTIAS